MIHIKQVNNDWCPLIICVLELQIVLLIGSTYKLNRVYFNLICKSYSTSRTKWIHTEEIYDIASIQVHISLGIKLEMKLY